jgi:hypothetical protein
MTCRKPIDDIKTEVRSMPRVLSPVKCVNAVGVG